jgi:putative tryptophan/tyrosine transport system substrate-binding protein
VDVRAVDVHDPVEIERAIVAFARSGNGGLILTTSALSAVHRDLIITLAARYKLPAVYRFRFYASGGGLISYGTNFLDEFRRAAKNATGIMNLSFPDTALDNADFAMSNGCDVNTYSFIPSGEAANWRRRPIL